MLLQGAVAGWELWADMGGHRLVLWHDTGLLVVARMIVLHGLAAVLHAGLVHAMVGVVLGRVVVVALGRDVRVLAVLLRRRKLGVHVRARVHQKRTHRH